MKARLVIYPGLGKTGTTALQVLLRCSPAELAALGYEYAGDMLAGDSETIGSGNADILARLLGEANPPLARIEELANLIIPETGNAIIASELLSHLDEQQWQRFAQLDRVAERRTTVVVAIRNLYPSAWSAYNQDIKRGGYFGEFSDWARSMFDTSGSMFGQLAAMRSVFGADEVTVLHFESSRSNLIETLLTAAEIPLDGLDLSLAGSTAVPHNRSLTDGERAVMRAVNRSFGAKYSTALSDLLLRHTPPDRPELLLDAEALDFLDRNFGAQYAQASTDCFGDDQVLGICSAEIRERFADGSLDAHREPPRESTGAALATLLRKERRNLPDRTIKRFLKGLRKQLRASGRIDQGHAEEAAT